VQLVDKANDRPFSTDDKNTMIDSVYSEWTGTLWTNASSSVQNNFDDAAKQFAIDRVKAKLK
jgi:hypothetical protein